MGSSVEEQRTGTNQSGQILQSSSGLGTGITRERYGKIQIKTGQKYVSFSLAKTYSSISAKTVAMIITPAFVVLVVLDDTLLL